MHIKLIFTPLEESDHLESEREGGRSGGGGGSLNNKDNHTSCCGDWDDEEEEVALTLSMLSRRPKYSKALSPESTNVTATSTKQYEHGSTISSR